MLVSPCSRLSLVVLLVFGGCAARSPGSRPHDMGAEAHEATAVAHEAEATTAEAQYDPKAIEEQHHCGGGRESRPCWTTVTNPTESHLREAERHRQMAATHRAASVALQQAEATACAGLDEQDRDQSPFEAHAADIATVEPAMAPRGGKQAEDRLVGAVVTIRAVEGLTAEWLQRVVDCHLARNAAVGHEMPEMPDCPLVPAAAEARVSSSGGAFAVVIRSDSSEAAADILARAKRLQKGRAP